MSREKILEVKDLTVSFNTYAGKVQAVRGNTFDLYKGEVLAIVGESGSGKSVTVKTLMGIAGNNAVIERGTAMYKGQDLTKNTEKDICLPATHIVQACRPHAVALCVFSYILSQ